jgi:hypothetical protein
MHQSDAFSNGRDLDRSEVKAVSVLWIPAAGARVNEIVLKDERLDHTISTFARNWWHLRLWQLSAIVGVRFNAGITVTKTAIALAQLCSYLRCGIALRCSQLGSSYPPRPPPIWQLPWLETWSTLCNTRRLPLHFLRQVIAKSQHSTSSLAS